MGAPFSTFLARAGYLLDSFRERPAGSLAQGHADQLEQGAQVGVLDRQVRRPLLGHGA
jgi:hypothetical protein